MKRILFVCAIMFSFAMSAPYAAQANEDGAALYKKSCAGCHGANGERKVGGSEALHGKSSAEIEKMLLGYKDGSFGGKQKGTMQNVMKKLSDEQTKAVSDFVGTLQ